MILYYSPGACSLAVHIGLNELGLVFDRIRVDLGTHIAEDGSDFWTINPKGYVPAIVLTGGELLTENIAILSWIADQKPRFVPQGDLGRYRLLEMLAFISTEIHKSFKPFFAPGSTDSEKAKAAEAITRRLEFLADRVGDGFLFGEEFSVADAYLFVMLTWATQTGVDIPAPLVALAERTRLRPAVRSALLHEGLA